MRLARRNLPDHSTSGQSHTIIPAHWTISKGSPHNILSYFTEWTASQIIWHYWPASKQDICLNIIPLEKADKYVGTPLAYILLLFYPRRRAEIST